MLTLVMIVKNEAETIVQTLQSVKGIIDHWYVLDTGSTDATPELVFETLCDIPGELAEGPFVDFSTTRNAAATAAEQRWPGTFVLMLSGTEEVVAARRLRLLLDEQSNDSPHLTAYQLPIHFGENVIYPSTRLFRATHWWHHGRTHEVLLGPNEQLGPVFNGCHIHHKGRPGGENKTERWTQDLELLKLDMRDGDPRAKFYFAQTLECLGHRSEACAAYGERAQDERGYLQERFIALLRCGRLTANPDTARAHFLAAFELDPQRAESLYELALWHHLRQQYAQAYLYARHAYEMAPRADRLFIERDVYDWKAADMVATHAERFEARMYGWGAAQQAFAANPGNARIQANWTWYRDRCESQAG